MDWPTMTTYDMDKVNEVQRSLYGEVRESSSEFDELLFRMFTLGARDMNLKSSGSGGLGSTAECTLLMENHILTIRTSSTSLLEAVRRLAFVCELYVASQVTSSRRP